MNNHLTAARGGSTKATPIDPQTMPAPAPATPTGQTPATVVAGASHETQAAAFASDPRIHFSTVTRRWAFEDDDGNEFEYDPVKATWLPVVRNLLVLCVTTLRKYETA